MATRVSFTGPSYRRPIYFDDLNVNDGFRIVGAEAVYVKIVAGRTHNAEARMLEIDTGKYWPKTTSPVEIVDIDITVRARKPLK